MPRFTNGLLQFVLYVIFAMTTSAVKIMPCGLTVSEIFWKVPKKVTSFAAKLEV